MKQFIKTNSKTLLLLLVVTMAAAFVLGFSTSSKPNAKVEAYTAGSSATLYQNWADTVDEAINYEFWEYLTITNNYTPSDTDAVVDVGTNGLKAYFNEDDSEVTIYADVEKIYAPTDSSGLFSLMSLSRLTLAECFDTSRVTDMRGMFECAESLIADRVSIAGKWDTSNVTDMSSMFYGTNSLNVIPEDFDIGNWDTRKVDNMASMFYGCPAAEFNLSGWDTSNVTDMSGMFNGCGGNGTVSTIDLSGWDTRKVETMNEMFYSSDVDKIDISGFTISADTDVECMFYYGSPNSILIAPSSIAEGVEIELYSEDEEMDEIGYNLMKQGTQNIVKKLSSQNAGIILTDNGEVLVEVPAVPETGFDATDIVIMGTLGAVSLVTIVAGLCMLTKKKKYFV